MRLERKVAKLHLSSKEKEYKRVRAFEVRTWRRISPAMTVFSQGALQSQVSFLSSLLFKVLGGMSISAELYEFIVRVVEEKVKDIKVTREEFDALRRSVEKGLAELASAQAATERRLEELARRVDDLAKTVSVLAEAQAATERRLSELARRVDDLAAAQVATERRLEELARRVDDLAKRVDDLAAAQAATERRVEELAAAQAETQKQVKMLASAVDALRVQVGKLSETIGFSLEDLAKELLPLWLHNRLGVEVERLDRGFIELEGQEIEVDLYTWGARDGKKVLVVGEVKSRIYEKDVDVFYQKVVEPLSAKVEAEVVGVLFGFLIHPKAESRARELGLYTVTAYGATR